MVSTNRGGLRVALLLLILDLTWALIRHPVCKVEGNDHFDLLPLKRGEEAKPYYAVSPGGHYHYYFNFCGHAAGCNQQPACQVRLETDSAGRAKEDIRTVTTTGELYMMKWELMDKSDLKIVNDQLKKDKAKKSKYESGVKVSYAIGPKHRKTVIRLPCDPDASPELGELRSPATVIEKPILTYNIIFPSSKACETQGSLVINVPSVHNVAHSKMHFFGLLFFVLFVVYCCAGCYYKRERLGAQGMEMIPHIDSITACVEGIKGVGSGESAVGGLLNRARGVSDDGL